MKLLPLFVGLCLSLSAVCQDVAPLQRNWKVGDHFEVHHVTTQQEDGGEIIEEDNQRYTVEIVSGDASSSLMHVMVQHPLFDDEPSEEVDLSFDVPESLTYQIRFSKNEPGMDIENWEAVSESVIGPFEVLEAELEKEDDGFGGFLLLMFDAVIEPYRTKKNLESKLGQELRQFVDPYFLEFDTDTLRISSMCPNPVKPDMETDMERAIWHSSEKGGNTVIHVRTNYDMSALLAPMYDMIMAMAMAEGDEMSDEDRARMDAKLAELEAMEMTAVMTESFTIGADHWPVASEGEMVLKGNDGGRDRESIIRSTTTFTRKK